ncbi:MAG TPA: TonB-dependent receptor [Gemmatimonadales bacterium]|nr:TonB-dependent receptor [Gemmatimonadales bacterium]
MASSVLRHSLVALLLSTTVLPAAAQAPGTGSIRGSVSGPDGPVAEATVRLLNADRHASTDRAGEFRLDDVPVGEYTMEVAAVGFLADRRPVRVVGDSVITLAVSLRPEAQRLAEVSVTGPAAAPRPVGTMPEAVGGAVFPGKKTTVLALDSLDINAAQDVSRQVLGRVPGLNVSETEGAGFPSNGIGFRGLNPTQSTEVNVRQDGYNIAADPYGYPEAYFLPPAEALSEVQLVRGASSLGFGSMFGGAVNYVIRDGTPGSSPVARARFTGGSYGAIDGFGDVVGGAGPVTYYGFAQYGSQNGWRPNGDVWHFTGFGRVRWQASPKWRFGIEYTLFRNEIHMPGGLTDEEFNTDPSASFRTRNWLASPWNVLALTADYAPAPNVVVHTTVWGNLSQRYLVWRNEDGGAGAPDDVDPATGEFTPREVEREKFSNATIESRLNWSFPLFGRTSTLAAGIRAFAGRMHRQEGGPGTTGSDFDMTVTGPYEKDVNFYNTNLAGHIEQVVRLGERLIVTPGIRLEYLHSTTEGYTDTTFNPLARNRTFALPGVAAQFRTSSTTELYGSVARSYRPIDYSSLTPFASVSRIDPNLRDPNGYTTDLGWRGTLAGSAVAFDVGVFRIRYGDRIGLVSDIDPDGTPFTLRTNTGTSVHRGVEAYLEVHPLALLGGSGIGDISLFDAFAYTDAKYVEGEFEGNRVEYAPEFVNRLGLTYARGPFSGTFQVSSVSQQFGDANNTIGGDDANVGLVPAYAVLDLTARARLGRRFSLGGGVNNLADKHYFTRRTDEYPGPGIIPSPGRSVYLTLGADF